ncbi:sortase B protein-sorting domain-containing protein [Anaerostipes sp.]|uniref:sortase B protein-sorting domain-containing protein n=1 Tax=Anaerostipes sp. TaxID=1872530 RepID=UPI00352800DA
MATELADKKDTCTTPVQVAAPKTGDSANLILYGGIAMVSLVLLLGVLIIFLVKRRHK